MTTTLIITTYNRPDFLYLTLQSLHRQSRMPDELIVADDGSNEDTKRLVEAFTLLLPFPVKHIWQEDCGFRRSTIINKAVAAAKGDYIIQIDGDIMMHNKFVSDHIRLAHKGYFVKGSRIRLSPKYTAELRVNKILPRYISIFSHGILSHNEKIIRLPWLGIMLSMIYGRKAGAVGCNMAYWRKDFIAVNGYDETVEVGSEDFDLSSRLTAAGCKSFKPLRMCLCYHLWHKASITLRATPQGNSSVRCERGISQYLKD